MVNLVLVGTAILWFIINLFYARYIFPRISWCLKHFQSTQGLSLLGGQVAAVLAAKDTSVAANAVSMLQQDKLLNDNLRAQGLPGGTVLSVSTQVLHMSSMH